MRTLTWKRLFPLGIYILFWFSVILDLSSTVLTMRSVPQHQWIEANPLFYTLDPTQFFVSYILTNASLFSARADYWGGGNPWWGQYFWFDEVDVMPPTSFQDMYGELGPWVRIQYGGRNRGVTFTGKFYMGHWFPFWWWPERIAWTDGSTVRTATFWVYISSGKSGSSATIDKSEITVAPSPFEVSTEESYELCNQAVMKVREKLEALQGITEDHICLVSFNRQIDKDTYELHIKVMDGDKAVIFGTDVLASLGKP